MKTIVELKFDRIVKEGFHAILKPLGFKKKENNFYLQRADLGHIINIQKSMYYSKDHINFTINTGIFVPLYWSARYNFYNLNIPIFPTEPECMIRKRIGSLKNQQDTWYDILESTNDDNLILEMKENLQKYILPYFDNIKNIDELLLQSESGGLKVGHFDRMIIYGELNLTEKAQFEYEILMNEKMNLGFRELLNEFKMKYGIK